MCVAHAEVVATHKRTPVGAGAVVISVPTITAHGTLRAFLALLLVTTLLLLAVEMRLGRNTAPVKHGGDDGVLGQGCTGVIRWCRDLWLCPHLPVDAARRPSEPPSRR